MTAFDDAHAALAGSVRGLNTGVPGKFRAVTPSDTVDLPDGPCDALWIGGAGNVSLIGASDTAAVTWTLPAGYHVGRFKRVRAASLTASNIIACYLA